MTQINNLKNDIAEAVRHNRNTMQRHEYIHHLLPGVITDQLYRKIHVVEDHVSNAWFNWTSRNVPVTMTPTNTKHWLNGLRDKPHSEHPPEEWQGIIDTLIQDVDSRIYGKFQRYKSYKCLATVEMKQHRSSEESKRVKRNATTPIILLGQTDNEMPSYSKLENYNAENHKRGIDRIAKNKDVLHHGLKLIGVKSN